MGVTPARDGRVEGRLLIGGSGHGRRLPAAITAPCPADVGGDPRFYYPLALPSPAGPQTCLVWDGCPPAVAALLLADLLAAEPTAAA